MDSFDDDWSKLEKEFLQFYRSGPPSFLLLTMETVGTIKEYISACFNHFMNSHFEDCANLAEIIIDRVWEKLNTGHWKEMKIEWRLSYSYAYTLLIFSHHRKETCGLESLIQEIKMCDKALLMGAAICDNVLRRLASILQKKLFQLYRPPECVPAKKMKFQSEVNNIPHFANFATKDHEILRISEPSLQYFRVQYLETKDPVVITHAMDHWPAFKKWDCDYIKKIAGFRTVPVELGSKYTDENWSQKLMLVNDFIDNFLLNGSASPLCDYCTKDVAGSDSSTTPKGYLAQHQLFDQISEFYFDVCIPEYCCLKALDNDTDEDIDINAWFGPGETVSPLHYDPKYNLLAQVFGEKYIRLYKEDETENLYPHSDHLLFNTSQVDIENPDLEKFPLFEKADYSELILKPGEMLYIPPKCWHYVKSLSPSFSVSFWWNYKT